MVPQTDVRFMAALRPSLGAGWQWVVKINLRPLDLWKRTLVPPE
jgi:hypothetical protein